MQDSPAAMMVIGALREIVRELKAIHEELQQLNQLGQRTDPGRVQFEILGGRQSGRPSSKSASAHSDDL